MFIKVKAYPDFDQDEVVEKSKDTFEVYTKVKPIQGQANQAIRNLLAQHLKIPVKNLRLVKGARERNKIFEIK